MILTPSPVTITRLEKAARDNGFDQELPREEGWLGFASTQAPLRAWLTTVGDALFIAAFSQLHVARALGAYGTPMASPLPSGAVAGRAVSDIPALHSLLRRAFQLSQTLPDELLRAYQKRTASLPTATEAERQVVVRVGQDLFRQGLLDYWEGRCAISGLAVAELLRASHIKPWAECASDAERLDVFNGLLLAPHLDAVFDRGFVTVSDEGAVVVSTALDDEARGALGLDRPLRVRALHDGHRAYLPWHRERVFKG
ncbi:MAG: HNH endonuclease [Myxococcales bacterium]|nr:HNH endonuclease [Myxococcales bacterium]